MQSITSPKHRAFKGMYTTHRAYRVTSKPNRRLTQWRNRREECPPETSDREISADLPGKEKQGKKGKWSRKEGKSKIKK